MIKEIVSETKPDAKEDKSANKEPAKAAEKPDPKDYQLTRALDLLDDSPAATRVLTCHHPILAPGGNHGRARTARAGKSVETIAQSCDLVLTGHLHETFALPAEAPAHTCWFVGAGTTFSRRTRGETAGFNALEIGEDTIRITHYTAHPDRPEFMATDDWSLARGRAA